MSKPGVRIIRSPSPNPSLFQIADPLFIVPTRVSLFENRGMGRVPSKVPPESTGLRVLNRVGQKPSCFWSIFSENLERFQFLVIGCAELMTGCAELMTEIV